MTSFLQAIVSIVGRIALSLIFVMSVVGQKIPKFNETVGQMQDAGVPWPRIALVGAIVFLIVGGLSVILGYKARIGATLLLIFLILAAYYFHDFWTLQGEQAQTQMIHFMKNLSMMGAMLFVIANGAGAGSIDARVRTRKSAAHRPPDHS